MADVLIVHPETGGTALVSPEALEHHYRQSGWMTPGERDEWLARVAEREEQPAKTAKGKTAAKSEEQ
jgi:hypothetical protein